MSPPSAAAAAIRKSKRNSDASEMPVDSTQEPDENSQAKPAVLPGAGEHPEYFSRVTIHTEDDPRRIDAVRPRESPPVPQGYRDLLRQIQDVARLLVIILPTDLRK